MSFLCKVWCGLNREICVDGWSVCVGVWCGLNREICVGGWSVCVLVCGVG